MDKEILDTSEEQRLEDMIDRNLSQHMNQPLEDDLLPNYGDKSNSVVVEVVDERSSSTSGPDTVPPNVENDKQEVENRIDSSSSPDDIEGVTEKSESGTESEIPEKIES